MFNGAFVLLSSTLYFAVFRTKRNLFLAIVFFSPSSSFPFPPSPFLHSQTPFVTATACLKCILPNWKCSRILLWVASFASFCLCFRSRQWGLTNGDTSKASSKWHDRFSTSFHRNKLQCRGTVTAHSLSGALGSVIPADGFCFNPVSALCFAPPPSPCSHPSSMSQSRRRWSDSSQWVYWIVW